MLYPEQRKKVVKTANAVLDRVWDGNLPVNAAKLVTNSVVISKDRRIEVICEHLPDGDKASSSAYYDEARKAYVCAYNREEICYRQNFALAHALGHVLLGHVKDPAVRKVNYTYQIDSADEQEKMACRFALEVLIPERMIRWLFGSVKQIQDASEAFMVSNPAMIYRVKALGLL